MEKKKRTHLLAILASAAVLSLGGADIVKATENEAVTESIEAAEVAQSEVEKAAAEAAQTEVDKATAEAAQAQTEAEKAAADAEKKAEKAAYQDALKAYRNAKAQNKMAKLETELSEMVAAGQLTQDQADLLLNAKKERQGVGSLERDGKTSKKDGKINKKSSASSAENDKKTSGTRIGVKTSSKNHDNGGRKSRRNNAMENRGKLPEKASGQSAGAGTDTGKTETPAAGENAGTAAEENTAPAGEENKAPAEEGTTAAAAEETIASAN